MSKLKTCRICLCSESKFYKFDTFNLKKYYEEIMTLPVSKADGLPKYFCYECAGLLHKFHLFREKCHYSQNALTEKLWEGQLTHAVITSIISELGPILKYGKREIIKISHRVGTIILEHADEENTNTIDIDVDENLNITVEDLSDNTFSDGGDINDSNNASVDIDEKEPELVLNVDVLEDNNTPPVIFEDEDPGKNRPSRPKRTKEKEKQEKAKDTKDKQPKKRREVKRKKVSYKSDTEDEDDDNKDLKGNRRRNATASDRKNVQFTKAKGGKPKVLKFLESGFWKKSFLSDEDAMTEFHAKAQDRKYLRAAYKCTDCYRGFSQKSMLDRHIPLKHGEALGPLVCRFCKCRFRTAYFLNKHMKLHYTRFECLRCNLVCNIDKSALFHEEYHNGVIRKCPHCDREFKHMSTFYTHLRTHRSKHMCTRCGESFVSQLGLYLHRKVKHINDANTIDEESTYCEVCDIKFDTAVAYNRHLLHSAMHTEEKAVEDDSGIKELMNDNGEDKEHNDSQNSEELYTRKSRVEKTLSAVRKRNLRRGQTKISKKPSTCQHCGKHFESQTACMKHHHAEHPRKPFYLPQDRVICEVCGVSLAPSSVPAHLNQHTRRKMYTCDTCGRSFTTNNMLRNHIVTHTGERNHACTICGKRFAQSGSLNLHHRTVHLKLPYPKRNRKKKLEEPNTEAGPFGGKEEYRVWRHYFDNSTYTNS